MTVPIRLLILPRYGALGASSRLRMLQYVELLRASGMEVDVSPLLGDDYVAGLYSGNVSLMDVARSYLRRWLKLFSIRRYDVVWVEKELFPWWPAFLDLAMIPKRTVLVVDYDDAVFHRYDAHRLRLVRSVLGRKIDAVMRRADVVTAGNDYLAQRAVQAGCKRVEWIPTVVDLRRYPNRQKISEDGARTTIGWIGSPSTAGYLKALAPALSKLVAVLDLRCVAIGARKDQVVDTPFEAIDWTEDTEVNLLRQLDIGIMPLQDAPWEKGKCGYKLIQYMACGLPVVASPVGVNCDIVRVGETGLLAATEGEWRDALNTLARDAALRTNMGKKGRAAVERVYSLQAQAPRLMEMLRSVASRSKS